MRPDLLEALLEEREALAVLLGAMGVAPPMLPHEAAEVLDRGGLRVGDGRQQEAQGGGAHGGHGESRSSVPEVLPQRPVKSGCKRNRCG